MSACEPGQVRKEAALSGSRHVMQASLTRAKHGGHAREPRLENGCTVHTLPMGIKRRIGVVLAAAFGLAVLGGSAAQGFAGYAVSTTPNSHDFGGQAVGTIGVPFSFTLRVHCDEDVAMPGTCLNSHPFTPNVAVSGDFAIRDNTCPATMPGTDIYGTSCTFGVVFAPRALGAAMGVVDVGEPYGFAKAGVTGTGAAGGAPPLPIHTAKKCKSHRSASIAKRRCKKRRR